MAQGKDRQQTEGKPHRLTVRMAEILGLEHGRVEQAFNQALGELRDERASSYLSRLVETGKVTQEQAEEKLEWLKANPNVKAGFEKKGMHRFFHSEGKTHLWRCRACLVQGLSTDFPWGHAATPKTGPLAPWEFSLVTEKIGGYQ